MKGALALCTLAVILLSVPAAAQGYGTITGTITTGASQAVPDAVVTLYDSYGYPVIVPDNPQLSSNGTGNNVGVYTFYHVPPGEYNVTAAKGEEEFFSLVTLEQGTATANVVLPGYRVTAADFERPEEPAPSGTPTALPRQVFTFVPATVRKPGSAAEKSSTPVGLAAAGTAAFLALFTWRKRATA